MRSITWKETAELVGLAAIIVGMIFVYHEIQQNSVIARATLMSDTSDYFERIHNNLSDPAFAELFVKSQKSPSELSGPEKIQLNAYFETVNDLLYREYMLFNFGIFEERQVLFFRLAPVFYGSGYGQYWWEAKKEMIGAKNFVALVEESLSESERTSRILKFEQRISQQIDES